ncbi:hypothetical protein J0H58_21620 [bacterium]|nr:hypothetical protein [bacterium]
MPQARIIEVCDAVVAAVLAEWAALRGSPVAAPDECVREYVVPVGPEEIGLLTGRKVWVAPGGYGGENASRGEDQDQHTVAVIVAERYPDGSKPPREWTDERVVFVERLTDLLGNYKPTRDPGPLLVGNPPRRHWTERSQVGVYDWAYLDEHHCFWSELEFEFRGVR